jgi:hypothetical protein
VSAFIAHEIGSGRAARQGMLPSSGRQVIELKAYRDAPRALAAEADPI